MTVKIDGIGFNAVHFAAMSKEDAVKEMKEGKILSTHGKDEKWAEKAYDLLHEKVNGPKPKVKKEKKESTE